MQGQPGLQKDFKKESGLHSKTLSEEKRKYCNKMKSKYLFCLTSAGSDLRRVSIFFFFFGVFPL